MTMVLAKVQSISVAEVLLHDGSTRKYVLDFSCVNQYTASSRKRREVVGLYYRSSDNVAKDE